MSLQFFGVYSGSGKILNLPWYFFAFGQFFVVVNGQILNKLCSTLVTLVFRFPFHLVYPSKLQSNFLNQPADLVLVVQWFNLM